MKGHAWSLCILLTGCFSPHGALTDEMPDDLPAGRCADTDTDACVSSTGDVLSTSTGGSSGPVVDECEGTEACIGNAACVAQWNADEEARGPFECRFACVPVLDEAAWCSDDASCCDSGARCTARGYCILDGGTTDGSSSSL